MERSLPNAFAPARNWGVSTFDYFEGEWGTWAFGAFRPAPMTSATTSATRANGRHGPLDGHAVVRRAVRRPLLFHVGGAASYRDPDSTSPILGNGAVRFSSTPEIRMREDGQPGGVPAFVDTGAIPADDFQLYGLEAAWVNGPLSVQAEYITRDCRSDGWRE